MSTPPKSAFAHSRQNSQDSDGSGSSYQLILEHILNYPGTYEIPLRTMYTLNCTPRAQPPLSTQPSRAPSPSLVSPGPSPTSPTFKEEQKASTAQFTAALMEQISQLPSQPSSLPPAFVTSFVNRCFPVELELVDFPQSLTALDYLRDLETRRRKEIAHSFKTLSLDESSLQPEKLEALRSWNPAVADWVEGLEKNLRRVENLYNNVYLSLRRWILINEMCLTPFNKANCLGMLNTLYPPVMSTQPTAKLTIPTLKSQREIYFKYVQTVEKRGPGCLETLMKQGRREGEENGWPAARRCLSQYLALANSIITECWDVNNLRFNPTRPLEPMSPPPAVPGNGAESEKRNGRKVDSGVSFGSHGQHSKSNSTTSAKSASAHSHRSNTETIGKGGTALERLAREFRKIRPKQKSVNEIDMSRRPSFQMMDQENSEDSGMHSPKPKGVSRLRKMKSLGALGDMKHSNSSSHSILGFSRSATPTFDPKEMKRQRDAYERKDPNMSY